MAGASSTSFPKFPPLSASTDLDSGSLRTRTAALWSGDVVDGETSSLALGPADAGEHSHFPLGVENFTVRGPDYLRDKVKVPASPPVFDLMHVDFYRSAFKMGNIAGRKSSWLRAARAAGDTRTYMVVSYVTPSTPFIHLVLYFAAQPSRVREAPAFERLWERFSAPTEAGDAFRNERWKVIPRIAEGPWAVQLAVGTKPALLGTKLDHTWVLCPGNKKTSTGSAGGSAGGGVSAGATVKPISLGAKSSTRPLGSSFGVLDGPGPYIEADCDVSSSSVAFVLVSLLQSSARYLVIDLGFAIEPREDETLPEAVLGAVRLSRMDVSRGPLISPVAGESVLGSDKQYTEEELRKTE